MTQRLKPLFVSSQIEAEDIIDSLCQWEYKDAIGFILALDLRFADVEFTEDLLGKLLTSLKKELDTEYLLNTLQEFLKCE